MCEPLINKVYQLIQGKPTQCPDCNGPVFRNGGCVYCPCCGWSSCFLEKINHIPELQPVNRQKGVM